MDSGAIPVTIPVTVHLTPPFAWAGFAGAEIAARRGFDMRQEFGVAKRASDGLGPPQVL